jgi:hypothetical protein
MTHPTKPAKAGLLWPIVFCVALVAGLLFKLPDMIQSVRPSDEYLFDFQQEWLSARNYQTGHPIYESQSLSIPRHLPGYGISKVLPVQYNAHPPFSVMLTLPFCSLGYHSAHFAWNLIGISLFLPALAMIAWEFRRQIRWFHLVATTSLVLWSPQVLFTIVHGQWNFQLAFLIVCGWILDRRDYTTAAGVSIGLAAAIKLFPAFLFVYFLFSGRWRALFAGVATFALANAAAVAVLGMDAFWDYFIHVMPGLTQFENLWHNISINGMVARWLTPAGAGSPQYPILAKLIYGLAAVGITTAVARAARRAKRFQDVDLGWAAAIAATPLVAPITWVHYLCIFLPVPVIITLRSSAQRLLLAWVLMGSFFFPYESLLGEWDDTMRDLPLSWAQNAFVASIPTYILFALFVLTFHLPARNSDARSD